MKKYYFLIDSMLWWWAERVVSNLVKKYVESWIEVYLFTLKEGVFYNLPKEVHFVTISKIKNDLLLLLLFPILSIKFKRFLKKFWLKEWISFLETSNFIHILAKKNADISLRIHISYYDLFLSWVIRKLLIRYLYPKAWNIIVNSRENKYELVKFLHISEDKVKVSYNPIDNKRIETLSNEKVSDDLQNILNGKKIFVTTWRLDLQKHHDKIIEALDLYNLKNKNRIYLIIWDWREKQNLKNLTKSFWLGKKILFLWQQANVFKYLKLADLFLYASEIEWFPNALLEAREMWLKIISSDFKTWAREVIFWENTDTIWKDLVYPVEWEYWVLIDWNNYVQQIQKYLSFEY